MLTPEVKRIKIMMKNFFSINHSPLYLFEIEQSILELPEILLNLKINKHIAPFSRNIPAQHFLKQINAEIHLLYSFQNAVQFLPPLNLHTLRDPKSSFCFRQIVP